MAKPDLILLHAPSNYDFRERTIMYGPISDVIPSTPVFEMYPIGLVSIGAYLERHGLHTRIINVANRMLRDPNFSAEKLLDGLTPCAFGIDLHWLPHAHGALELAAVVKRLHPSIPIIMGGLSASYYHKELIAYPQVDFIVRGDSTEAPLLQLMERLKYRGPVEDIPNLSWKDAQGVARHNPLTSVPADLDSMPLDYAYPVKSVLKYRDLIGLTPFGNWMDYPITCVITCRGCNYECVTCGGSRYAYRNSFGRARTAFRNAQLVVRDIVSIQRYLRGPVFVVGDIRQPGEDYADEFLKAMKSANIKGQVVLELFSPAPRSFFKKVAEAVPNYNIQWSPDSTDEEVRRAFGKHYGDREIEATIQGALENGCRRFDLFFMIGLPRQTRDSVMNTVSHLRSLLKEFGGEKRLLPFISPLAPFVDPGSRVFESPEEFGYNLICKTLEEHRQALNSPSWKYMLNYETEWMSREDLVECTYDAALAFNGLKSEFGLISNEYASGVEYRARSSKDLMKTIDRLVREHGVESREIASLKNLAGSLSASSICQKKELHWPAISFMRNAPRILWAFTTGNGVKYGA